MGLDLLDVAFRIERTFDVSFSDEDFVELARDGDIVVGDLYDLLLKKMHLRDVGRYDIRLNYALWIELQDMIHRVAEVPLDRVELKTPLESLFPEETRREAWGALRDTCPYRVRELDYPRVVRVAGFWLAMAMVLIEQFQVWQLPVVRWLWPFLGIFGVWMLVETYTKVLSVLAPWRTRFPSGMRTVKDFCRTVLATNYDAICRDTEIPMNEPSVAVWQQLVAILVDAIGVDAEEVTFHSRLIRDLGAE